MMEEKNRIRGRKARASGSRFERKVRAELESNGFICSKWQNNVKLPTTIVSADCKESVRIENKGKLVPAKMGRFRTNQGGFPDFIAYKFYKKVVSRFYFMKFAEANTYVIMGIECKSNGYLDKEEKKKCKWLLDNKIFSKILIAKKSKKRGEIEYKEFEDD